MDNNQIVDIILFLGFFLITTGILQVITNRFSFPYTVALLLAGFLAQFIINLTGGEASLSLPPDLIFYLLLPVLLFEAAIHINIHQFRLQFKTITFLATFGLLLSIFVIALILALAIGLPFGIALLFGAIISATDPIAVLALFKTLGAPKRLALVADGESMFNDATAVIAFRAISAFVVANQVFKLESLFDSTMDFLYVFLGSILVGIVIGYAASYIFAHIKNERVTLTALTTGFAIGSFAAAEHFFHLSGVITTVMMGITVGNFGRTKIPSQVMHFIEEYWEYFGFISLSLVFFFASFSLDFDIFGREIGTLAIVVFSVLVARAISVYVSAFISNRFSFFKDEPNLPIHWQHILNWGGLRGVIPLVLVYSLPETFGYRELLLQFTFATLLFTLFVNGLTIRWLLLKLKLHLPPREEQIIKDEKSLFEIEEMRKRLKALSRREFDLHIITAIDEELEKRETKYRKDLLEHSTFTEFLQSLKLEALDIERRTLHKLYEQGRFTETVLHTFESELDLQQDALEYPEMFGTRAMDKEGKVKSGVSFRKRLLSLRKFVSKYKLLSKILGITDESLVNDRYGLLRARIFTSYAVLEYLDRVEKLIKKPILKKAIQIVRENQEGLIAKNQKEIEKISEEYPSVVELYQRQIIQALIHP